MEVTGDAQNHRVGLGCQVWLEPDDSPERVDMLFARAGEAGLNLARIFLMWPWIESQPGRWDFGVFDAAFEAAARHRIAIKATLTANSGPWHVGTPAVLHSHTGFLGEEQFPAIREYVRRCVERYRKHPALGQWILWNEPMGFPEEGRRLDGLAHWESSPLALKFWREWLDSSYHGDIAALNRDWMTGYSSFAEIPMARHVPHPLHRESVWVAYRPALDEVSARAVWLANELQMIAALVRESDPATQLCINPVPVGNHAALGYDFDLLGQTVARVGASYHPVHQFAFAERPAYPSVMAVGVRLQASHPGVRSVEVTEVQTGNTVNSSARPCNVAPAEIARFVLASLAAGAEAVTGWCLNTRSRDFEAGDWGLLDDLDQPSPRSRMMRLLSDTLDTVHRVTGRWSPAPPSAYLAWEPRSQALEMLEDRIAGGVPGRAAEDGAHGALLLGHELLQLGILPEPTRIARFPASAAGRLAIVSHIVAWDTGDIGRLTAFASSGSTVLMDGSSGRRSTDARLFRPWPGGLLEELGFHCTGMDTHPDGFAVDLLGTRVGRTYLTRALPEFSDKGWRAWPELRFACDERPVVWERQVGAGRFVYFTGLLGASLPRGRKGGPVVSYVLNRIAGHLGKIRAAGRETIVLPVAASAGDVFVALRSSTEPAEGGRLHLSGGIGPVRNLWNDSMVEFTCGEAIIEAPEGIAILFLPLQTTSS
jgi:beta-galactosidase